MLAQVANNLIYNAVLHARGNVAIKSYEKGCYLIIDVLDDGPTLLVSSMPQLADRHFRNRLEQSIGCPGWGLSLAIADSLCRSMGGEITLTSGVDQITKISLQLPLDGPA
jgi:signal transduction histidine kinase